MRRTTLFAGFVVGAGLAGLPPVDRDREKREPIRGRARNGGRGWADPALAAATPPPGDVT
jgi:hypothetical protein